MSAQAKLRPTATSDTSEESPDTRSGHGRLVVVPSPSCPLSFSPQHLTPPADVSAHAWWNPAPICFCGHTGTEVFVGVGVLVAVAVGGIGVLVAVAVDGIGVSVAVAVAGIGVSVAVAVGGTGVLVAVDVGGIGVSVAVAVGGTGVSVAVAVAGTGVFVAVAVGGSGVFVAVAVAGIGVLVAVAVGGTGVLVGVAVATTGVSVAVAVGQPDAPQSGLPFREQLGGSSANAQDAYSQSRHGTWEVFVAVTVAVCACASPPKIAEATISKVAMSANAGSGRPDDLSFLFFAEF